ncbi:MAG TPA: pyridoxamine 5'-phosphate oxidase family protein [Rudaea sp.]|nr:pyridoxamine 5'-phosphate oxidase family protein [Rudaea sp.]
MAAESGLPRDWAALSALLAEIEIATLVTRAADGSLVGRPLQTLKADPHGALWFFTSAESAKLADIGTDPHVNLVYADPAHKRFVSIAGTAEIVRDRARIDALWSAAQTVFFPEGRDDPNLVLLKVEPSAARCWDGNESALGLALKFGKAVLLGKASDLGSHVEIDPKDAPR